jgi:4-alpha-methyl-delta7-sterol-4alpha-methyl oxidase
MLETWLAAYRDPMLLRFAVATNVLSMGAFLLFAIPMSVIAARDPAWARPYRIQSRKPRAQDLVGPSLWAFLRNNLILFALVLAAWPVLRKLGIHDGPMPAAWVIVAQVVFFIYLDDFLYYFVHRAMHRGLLWKHVHSVHHRIHTPWAITGHYMHPIEYVTTASLMLVGPLLVGAHLVPLFVWVTIRQWEAAEGHAGYDFPWSPTHLLPGSHGALHHDFHHAKVKGNYAGFLAYVDRLFGTYAKGYEEARAARASDATKPR